MTCPICEDDGWVDIPDEVTGGVLGARECPRLNDSGHAPFNANGLLDQNATAATAIAPERHPSQWSNDAPSTNANPALIRKERST